MYFSITNASKSKYYENEMFIYLQNAITTFRIRHHFVFRAHGFDGYSTCFLKHHVLSMKL